MAAFNWLKQEINCPICRRLAPVVVQFHVWSSYGDPYYHHDYNVGDLVPWYDENSGVYEKGYFNANRVDVPHGIAIEYTIAECGKCSGEIYVAIKFINRKIIGIIDSGKWDELPWGRGFFVTTLEELSDPKFQLANDPWLLSRSQEFAPPPPESPPA